MARTTTRTLSIPATSVCAVKSPMTIRSSRSDTIACQPASNVRDLGIVAGSGEGSPAVPMRATNAIATSNRPAVTTKTVPTSVAASRSAPSAGPTKRPTLSTALAMTFAAVSSSGVDTREGVSAA